jgi:hypothetical protein
MSVCDTKIEYNDVLLSGVLTESISYDPVYDQTGCDLIGIHTRVVVTAYAHASTVFPTIHGVNAVWTSGVSPWPPALTAMFRKLSMPRRRFRMTVNNFTMFDILPTAVEGRIVVNEGEGGNMVVLIPGQEPVVQPIDNEDEEETVACNPTPTGTGLNQDIAHGPKCSYQVMGIKGGQTAKCRFTFEFTTPLCENPALIKDFLHLRYWIADDIDCTAWLTTRTYQGTFRVKGMQVDSHALARQITLPPLQPGFRRTRINWSESPDHLTLNFTIVDIEQYNQAPSPATHWEGSYSVSMPQGNITAESTLQFRLWSHADIDKRDLFILAQRIIDIKLNYQEMINDHGSFVVMAQVWEEKLEANEVSCYVKIKHLGKVKPDGTRDRFSMNVQPFGDKFLLGAPLHTGASDFRQNPARRMYDRKQAYLPDNGLPPAGMAGIFICALQTPCCPQTLDQTKTKSDVEPPYPDLPTLATKEEPPRIEEVDYDTGIANRYSDSHMEFGYLFYRMTNHYHKDTGWRGFPTGKQCNVSSGSLAFSRVHCPVAVREIRVEACRMNKCPEMPDFRDSWIDDETGIRYVLKDVVFEPMPPQLSADARHEIREMYARYFYYMSRPPNANEDWLAGRLPYVAAGTKPLADEPDGKPGTLVPTEAFKDPATIFGREAPNNLLT